jgi:hypothetical protein
MNNLDLVFLFIIFLFILYFKSDDNKSKHNKSKHHKPINKLNYIVNNEYNNIYLEDDLFYKRHYTNIYDKPIHENEIKILNRGKINRQSIISEKGGSKIFKNYKVQSNINDKIKYNDNKSYKKLPYKLNK